MRAVAEYLEKAEAFEQLATLAPNELLSSSYRDLAKAYCDLAKDRHGHVERLGSAPNTPEHNSSQQHSSQQPLPSRSGGRS